MPTDDLKKILIEWGVKPIIGAFVVAVFLGIWSYVSNGTPLKIINAVVKSDIEELKEKDIKRLETALEQNRSELKKEIDENETELNNIKNYHLNLLRADITQWKSSIETSISNQKSEIIIAIIDATKPIDVKLGFMQDLKRRSEIYENIESINKGIEEIESLIKANGD